MRADLTPTRILVFSFLLLSWGTGKIFGQQVHFAMIPSVLPVWTGIGRMQSLAEMETLLATSVEPSYLAQVGPIRGPRKGSSALEDGGFTTLSTCPPPLWVEISAVEGLPGYDGRSTRRLQGWVFDLMTRGNLAALVGVLMLAAAAWVVILRRQVRAKTAEIREWLRREAALTDRYRDLLENAIDMVYTRDLQGNFTSVNNTTVRVLGYTRQELLRMNIAQIVAPGQRDSVRQALESVLAGRASVDAELDVITKNGARLAIEARGRPLFEDGKVVGVQGIARNVTERERVEHQVRLQAAALETAALGIMITDRDGNFLWVNPAFTAMSGYSLEEVVGENFGLLKSGAHNEQFYRDIWYSGRSGRVWRGDITTRRKDGSLYREELTLTPVCRGPGEITHFVITGQDISARKQAEETRAQLAAIVESSNDAIMGISPQGLIVSWNRGAEALCGYNPEEILGKPLSILTPPELSDELSHLFEQVHQGQTITNFETVLRGKAAHIPISLGISPIKNAQGKVVGSSAIARDITQHRQAEEALRQSEEKYRSIVLNIPDVVWTIDSRGSVVFISPNIERMGGFTAEEVRAGGLEILFATMHPGDVQSMKETLAAAFTDQQPREVEYRGRRNDGRWIWVRVRTTGSYEKDGVQYLHGLLSDITERKQAEEELALLKHSIDVHSDGAYWTDVDNRIFYVNDAGCKALGYNREELIGNTVCDVIPAASPEMLKGVWESLRRHGSASFEAVHRRKDGSEFPVELVITYVQFSGREFACGFARDVTERRNFESRLRLQSAALEAAANGIVITDRQGTILWVNPGFSALTGYPLEEAIGKNPRILKSDQQPPALYKDLWETILAGNVWHGELTNRRKDGTLYEEEMTITPVRDETGTVAHFIAIKQDVTQRKWAEKALRESEQFSREVIASAREGVVVYDREFRYLVWNRYMEELTGVPALEALGKVGFGLFPHLREQKIDGLMQRALAGEVVQTPDMPFHVPSTGKSGWTSAAYSPRLDASGEILGVIGIIHEVTERKRAEARLRESEQGLAAAQRIAHIGSWYWNAQTDTAHWSDETFRIFGQTPSQLENHRQVFLAMVHPEDRMRVDCALTEALNETREYNLDYRLQMPDGTERVIHAQGEVLKDEAGKPLGIRGINHDITERKHAEEMLQESEERFRQLAENVEEVLLLFDLQLNKVFYVSPAYEKVWGRSCESLYASPRSFLDGIHPDDHPDVAASLELSNRSRGEWEYRVIRPNGTVRWVWDRAFPIHDSVGRVVRIAELVQDITERKQVEVATHIAMKAAEDANRAKSEFLANMSHELWTPMNAVIGMTELALATDLDPEQRHYLELVESSADSLLELINHILDFSKIEAGKLELKAIPFILADVMEEALRPLAKQAYRKGLEMACALDPTIPSPLLGDPARLKQIVMNLVENAIKFTERGEVVVRARVDSQTESYMTLHISVADTGVGIPDDKIATVFEAFTQADGSATRRFEGAGLGLAICSELIRMMGGSISVESDPGQGSTFHVIVRLDLAAASASPSEAGGTHLLQGAPVLVVDDHATSREILADKLRHRGFVPTLVEGAAAALASIREAQNSASPFRLALISAQMPSGDGFGLAEQARQIPGFSAPILIMLPPTDVGRDANRCHELGILDYCTKPVLDSDMVKVVAKALETASVGNSTPNVSGSPQELGRVLRVLLAESNEVTQVLVTHLLEKRGHRVIVAVDGLQAMGAIEDAGAQDFDVVLMDTELPGMNGMEVARAIREIERRTGGRIPVIAMTANPSPGEEEACGAADMDAYLAKPCRPRALFESIQRVTTSPSSSTKLETLAPIVFDKSGFLSRLEGDEQLGWEVIEMFLREYPKLKQNVRSAAEQRNPSLLERAAHALKGSVGDVAAPQAFEAARILEQMARGGKLDAVDAQLVSLEGALDRLVRELRKVEKNAA